MKKIAEYRGDQQNGSLHPPKLSNLEETRQEAKKAIPPNTLIRSFSFAFQGIFYVLRTQRNMRLHLLAGLIVVAFGLFFQVSTAEWVGLLTVMALIYALEMLNTVIEAIVDMVTQEYHPLAKIAKDVGAGAVLIASLFSVVIALIVFAPRILHFIFNW